MIASHEIIELLNALGLLDGIAEQGHFLERAELSVVTRPEYAPSPRTLGEFGIALRT